MEFRVLGQLEIVDGDRDVRLGSHKQRSLLALLLIDRGSVLSTDHILDELWGDEAADRQNALWVHVSNLRSALEPAREPRSEGTVLLTRAPGYVLHVEGHQVDATLFEQMVSEGLGVAGDDPETGSTILREALALWRGRAYEEFTYDSFAQAEIARLDELRLMAVEARIGADLMRGWGTELVSELTALSRQHPLREGFTGQLMLALYRSGRQSEALRACGELRSRLGRELGIEPSVEVRALEERILQEDPTLWTGGKTTGTTDSGLTVRGYEMREPLGSGSLGEVHRAYQPEVGREVAVTTIPARLADEPRFIRRFEGEARMVASLEHPHILPVYDFWREPGAAFLVSRFMPGGTLADLIDHSALSEADAARVVGQLGNALGSAHRNGIVHGAIRPENVLLDGEGNAYLTGFGFGMADLEGAPTAAPEIRRGAAPTPGADVYSLAVVMAQSLLGLRGRPEQIAGALPPPVAEVIARATHHDPSVRPSIDAFVDQLVGRLEPDSAETVRDDLEAENPYLGLAAFGPGDADVFFGRQRIVDRLLGRMAEPGLSGRMIALVGASGSGKSSLVQAGLLPALHRDALPGASEWFTTSMIPGAHPFEALEDALLRIAVDPPATLFEQLAAGENGLRRAARRILPDDRSQLLIVVDQFEELFTLTDDATTESFLDALAGAVNDLHSRVRVVVTLRADFYDRPLRHRGFGELLRDGTEVITPMAPEEFEQAITGPVEHLGVAFAPAVVSEMVREVQGRPGALPLLQYALTELFDQRTGPLITTETYARVGGVTGALVKRAEDLYEESDEDQKVAVQQVFLRLITLGEGSQDTRRRVLRAELEDLPVSRRALDEGLHRFSTHRLLTFDRDPITRGPTVEISHESLLSEWDRLRLWIDAAREDVRNQRRLADLMGEWAAAGKADDHLLTGGRLARLATWANDTDLSLGAAETSFLDASVDAAERAEGLERQREQEMVEAGRQARRRLRQSVLAVSAAAVVGVLALVAFFQAQAAERSEAQLAAILEAQQSAVSSTLVLRDDLPLAIQLAIEAAAATAEFGTVIPEAMDSLHWVVQESRLAYPADGSTPVAVRPGLRGPTGVFALAPNELIALAQSGLSEPVEGPRCAEALRSDSCPDPFRAFPDGLTIAGGDEAYGVVASGPGSLAGTKLDLITGLAPDNEGFEAELVSFEQASEIVISNGLGQVEGFARRERDREPLPDLVMWAAPSHIEERSDDLIDLSAYLDVDRLRDDFGEDLLDMATVDGALHAIPADADLKGLVFFAKPAFEKAGYGIPDDWAGLIELSEQMVADGRAPWCHSFDAGAGTGWPGTDLVETMVLRVGGAEVYDAWLAHEIPFDHPTIVEAGGLVDRLLNSEGFARGGSGSITSLNPILEGLDPLLGEDPECFMMHQGDFMMGFLPPQLEIGLDIDWFSFPPIEAGSDPAPQYGGGQFMAVFQDRPEVRVFVEHVASNQWGNEWAATLSSFLSPNARFDTGAYGRDLSPATAEVMRSIGETVRIAIAEGVFRFDASDLMPPVIGGVTLRGPTPVRGAFYQGMMDVADGKRTMDATLAGIEDAWIELEASHALADDAGSRLRSEGFSDDQIRRWAEAYVAEMGAPVDLRGFYDWISESEAAGD